MCVTQLQQTKTAFQDKQCVGLLLQKLCKNTSKTLCVCPLQPVYALGDEQIHLVTHVLVLLPEGERVQTNKQTHTQTERDYSSMCDDGMCVWTCCCTVEAIRVHPVDYDNVEGEVHYKQTIHVQSQLLYDVTQLTVVAVSLGLCRDHHGNPHTWHTLRYHFLTHPFTPSPTHSLTPSLFQYNQ